MNDSVVGRNLLPPPIINLPDDPALDAAANAATLADFRQLAAEHPTSPLAWALLAQAAAAAGADPITVYAYARVGYHRSLDALRKSGWKGQGQLNWDHLPNRGVLQSWFELRQAAEAIGELDEHSRLTQLLRDANPQAIALIKKEV